MKKTFGLVLMLCCITFSKTHAADGMALIGGTGGDAEMAAVAVQWDWERKWIADGDWFLGGYWELGGSYLKGDGSGSNKILGIGITPVFRLEKNPINNFAPYLEGGIGIHHFNKREVNDEKRLGTNFNFGDHLGVGIRFGENLKYDIGYRFQHYSNAGMTDDNSGINFHQLRFRYSY
jgi:lipid A 3-O-deacylase